MHYYRSAQSKLQHSWTELVCLPHSVHKLLLLVHKLLLIVHKLLLLVHKLLLLVHKMLLLEHNLLLLEHNLLLLEHKLLLHATQKSLILILLIAWHCSAPACYYYYSNSQYHNGVETQHYNEHRFQKVKVPLFTACCSLL
jgi:hypothetical protein